MNGFLFDIPPELKPTDQRQSLSHRADPETSRDAARRLIASGKLSGQRRAVLDALRRCDGATHAELGRAMGCDWLVAARRLPELERAGFVRKGKARTCSVKGSNCTTWWIVEGPNDE